MYVPLSELLFGSCCSSKYRVPWVVVIFIASENRGFLSCMTAHIHFIWVTWKPARLWVRFVRLIMQVTLRFTLLRVSWHAIGLQHSAHITNVLSFQYSRLLGFNYALFVTSTEASFAHTQCITKKFIAHCCMVVTKVVKCQAADIMARKRFIARRTEHIALILQKYACIFPMRYLLGKRSAHQANPSVTVKNWFGDGLSLVAIRTVFNMSRLGE